MSIASKFLDDYLFAPNRYLNEKGDGVRVDGVRNFFNDPAVKIASIAGIIIAFNIASSEDQNNLDLILQTTTLAAIACHVVKKRIPSEEPYYLDTKPKEHKPLTDPALRSALEKDKDALYLGGAISVLSLGPIYFAFAHTQDPVITGTAFSTVASYLFTDYAAQSWRAQKALSGEWNVSLQPPAGEFQPLTKRPKLPPHLPAP